MRKKIKFILPCFIIFLLMGCNLNNTPTSKVEERLSFYQMLDSSINLNDSIALFTNGDNLTESQKGEYEKIIKKQYKSLSYDVKEEMVDGDSATVTVQIEVLDYKKLDEELDNEINRVDVGVEQYHNQRIEKFKDAKERIAYTIEFRVQKDNNGDWKLLSLDSTEEEKILGIY